MAATTNTYPEVFNTHFTDNARTRATIALPTAAKTPPTGIFSDFPAAVLVSFQYLCKS